MTNKQINFKFQISNFKFIFVVFAYLFICLFVFSARTSAQTSLPLMVIPARQQLEVSPGEKTNISIDFYNKGVDPLSGFFKVADFIVVDNKGTPQLIENANQAPAKYSGAGWFTLQYDRATLPANNKVTLIANISVPADAHPGGRYVAIYFEPGSGGLNEGSKSNSQAGSSITARIASLVYIRVKGPITEKAIISRFFTPSFLEYGPVKIDTDILNRGDYHITPQGVVSISNMFGAVVDQQPLAQENIFPDTFRTFENTLGTHLMMGHYKITLTAAYGDQGQALTAATDVWIFPWKMAAVVILTLIIIIILIRAVYKRVFVKEETLESELQKEKDEIEKLKQQLRKRE